MRSSRLRPPPAQPRTRADRAANAVGAVSAILVFIALIFSVYVAFAELSADQKIDQENQQTYGQTYLGHGCAGPGSGTAEMASCGNGG